MTNETHRPPRAEGGEKLEIYTLGRFLVRRGGQQLSAEPGRSKKIWELFLYLITHRDKPLPAEAIAETLWPEQEYSNPKSALKNLVHRLRKELGSSGVPDAASAVIHTHGGYVWNNNFPYWLDAESFELLCLEAHNLTGTDPSMAVSRYREALALYRGEYLHECPYSNWVLPARHYYRRLFVRSITELLALQKEQRHFSQMAENCEKALFIEHFEEDLHLRYIEALLGEGKSPRPAPITNTYLHSSTRRSARSRHGPCETFTAPLRNAAKSH